MSRGGKRGERSAAEREAAFLERQRRRAEKEGKQLPPQEAEHTPWSHAGDEQDPFGDRQPFTAAERPTSEGDRQEELAAAQIDERYDDPVAADEFAHSGEYELPTTVGSDLDAGSSGGSGGRRLPPIASEHVGIQRRSQRRSLRRTVLLVLLLIVMIAVIVLVNMIWQPLKGEGGGTVVVRIPQGATTGQIGDLLAANDVVARGSIFNLRAKLSSKGSDLKAGTFTLKRDMSYAAAIEALTKNTVTAATFNVTIPEGPAIAEVADVVATAGVRGSYRTAAQPRRRNALLDRLGAPRAKRSLEGLLFPATYELRRKATARTLVRRQLAAFQREFAPTRTQARASCSGQRLSPYQVVIVASMVEREALVARERPLIAGVICNRLKRGIPLGIDATIRYRLGNWSRPLRRSELERDTAYNTRLRRGLPPGPIGSPGTASLMAALRPSVTKSLFYVVKPCGNGAHSFSATEQQFQRDVAAYNKKRNELGGKDPRRC